MYKLTELVYPNNGVSIIGVPQITDRFIGNVDRATYHSPRKMDINFECIRYHNNDNHAIRGV